MSTRRRPRPAERARLTSAGIDAAGMEDTEARERKSVDITPPRGGGGGPRVFPVGLVVRGFNARGTNTNRIVVLRKA